MIFLPGFENLPVVFVGPVKEELYKSFSKGRGEEGIEYRVDAGVGIGKDMRADLEKIFGT